MATFFNKFCFAILSHSSPDKSLPTIFDSARRVLLQLHSRDNRRSFTLPDNNIWLLIKDPKKSLPTSLTNFFKKSTKRNNSNNGDNNNSSSSSNNNSNDIALGTSFLERVRNNDIISLRILNLLPHTIPFETRLEIFREYLRNSVAINDSEMGILITVRRNYVLEDAYKHLKGLTVARTKGKIRVKFVNEAGK